MKTGFKSKRLVFVVVLLMAALFAVGCGQGNQGSETPKEDPKPETPALSGTVTIAGSTSVQPLSEELANAFMAKNPGVRIEVSGGGSGAGIRAAESGAADIGAASRGLKADEIGVTSIAIAIDGIAVIVHPENPVNDLPFEDIQKIFRGEITNWSQVGGGNANIVVVNREEGSGTRGAFHELVVGEDNDFVSTAIIQNSTGAVREAVLNDVNAIGYISLGGINDSIKTVMVDGVEPTVENVRAQQYPIARPFNYVVKKDAQLSDVAQAFVDFVLSDEGQKVVEENGLVPVK
ncbi:MAG: phosphate ABC transporter substrate-binding protein [Clostridia bacterium]|jgi:phosphate transport system substrate-binding protein|nr:phosphate ABC transporter substrate-binding protein [Clostridia bacterium]